MPAVLDTSIGRVLVDWTDAGISQVVIGTDRPVAPAGPEAPEFAVRACISIAGHLSGEMNDFMDIPLDFGRSSEFCRKIWKVLRNISRPGSIMTYGQLALAAGSPGATRSVGSSMRKNPLPLLVPCHRVVAANGPGGYSAGRGLETKEFLIELEKAHCSVAHGEGGCR